MSVTLSNFPLFTNAKNLKNEIFSIISEVYILKSNIFYSDTLGIGFTNLSNTDEKFSFHPMISGCFCLGLERQEVRSSFFRPRIEIIILQKIIGKKYMNSNNLVTYLHNDLIRLKLTTEMGRLFLREPPYFSGCQQKLPSEVCTTTGQNVLGQVLPSFVNIKTTKKTKSRRNKVNMLMKITNYCSWLSNEITTSLYKSKYHNNTISQKLLRTHLLL